MLNCFQILVLIPKAQRKNVENRNLFGDWLVLARILTGLFHFSIQDASRPLLPPFKNIDVFILYSFQDIHKINSRISSTDIQKYHYI